MLTVNQYINLAETIDRPEYADLATDAERVSVLNEPVKIGHVSDSYFNRRRLATNLGAVGAAKLTLVLEQASTEESWENHPILANIGVTASEMAAVFRYANGLLDEESQNSINLLDPQTTQMINLLVASGKLDQQTAGAITKLTEIWKSPAEILVDQEITELDLVKARLIKKSSENFSRENEEYRIIIQSIKNYDGTGDIPSEYGV